MDEIEEERAADGVPLALRGHDALDDIAAAARLGALLPDRPPLHGERDDEEREDGVRIGEVREDRKLPLERGMRREPGKAADLR